MKIANKRVLITGGAKRVGAFFALAFARAGAKILLHYNHSSQEAAELLRTLPGSGHELFQAELADAEAAKKLLQQTGEADILINNASRYLTGTLLDETPEKDREQPATGSGLFQSFRLGRVSKILRPVSGERA